MSLTSRLKKADSDVSVWMREHIDQNFVAQFVAAQNAEIGRYAPIVIDGANPLIVGGAFTYLFSWYAQGNLRFKETVAYMGAKLLKAESLIERVVSIADEQPHTRPAAAYLMYLFEQHRRSGEMPETLDAMLSQQKRLGTIASEDSAIAATIHDLATLYATLPSIWRDYDFGDYEQNVSFVGSEDVGGADAQAVFAHTVLDIRCTRKRAPFTPANLYQQLGYVLLDYIDAENIQNLAWYYARQKCLLVYRVDQLFPNIDDLRESFALEFNRDLYDGYGYDDEYFPDMGYAPRFTRPTSHGGKSIELNS